MVSFGIAGAGCVEERVVSKMSGELEKLILYFISIFSVHSLGPDLLVHNSVTIVIYI